MALKWRKCLYIGRLDMKHERFFRNVERLTRFVERFYRNVERLTKFVERFYRIVERLSRFVKRFYRNVERLSRNDARRNPNVFNKWASTTNKSIQTADEYISTIENPIPKTVKKNPILRYSSKPSNTESSSTFFSSATLSMVLKYA